MIENYDNDKLNFTITDHAVRFLSVDDKLKKSDLIRELHESGSEGEWNTTYQPDAWRGTMWHTVDKDLHGWIGMTYRDYMEHANLDSRHHEICRVV